MSKIMNYADGINKIRARKASSLNESVLINEGAFKVGDSFMVMSNIEVKPSIINQFKRKAKEEHSTDLTERWSDSVLAEWLVNYVVTKYLNVESIPVAAILGLSSETAPGEAPATMAPPVSAEVEGSQVVSADAPAPAQSFEEPAMAAPAAPVMPEASIEKYA
jgi:hypothetical protein